MKEEKEGWAANVYEWMLSFKETSPLPALITTHKHLQSSSSFQRAELHEP